MASAVDSTPALNTFLDQVPSIANMPTIVGDRQLEIEDAIAFAEKADDGLNAHLWSEAALVIVGLSGMGKSPISKHLAEMGYKVGNFPLVRNCHIPDELFKIDQRRVVGLMITPDVLLTIRRERSYQWGVSLTNQDFTDYGEIEDEVKWAKRLYRQNPDWKVVSTTDRDPKDVAQQLAKWLDGGMSE